MKFRHLRVHPVACLIGGMVAYVLILSTVCHRRYSQYGYDDFDLAVYAQNTWCISRGIFDSSIVGVPILADHMALILFLIAPLYKLWPDPSFLLYSQTVVLAAGAGGVYLFASSKLSKAWGAALGLIYLTYPPLIHMNLYEFHPVAFASCFLIYAFHFMHTSRFYSCGVFFLLAMLCQENIALVVGASSAYLFLTGRRGRWVWAPLIVGMGYFLCAVLVVMPNLNADKIQRYSSLYGHLGNSLSEILWSVVAEPLKTVDIMLRNENLRFLALLLAPLAFLSLFSPSIFIPLLPILVQRLLSMRSTESSVLYHYQAEFIPFVFLSATISVRKLLEVRAMRRPIVRLTVVSLLLVAPIVALASSGVVPRLAEGLLATANDLPKERVDRLVDSIPPEASVVATFEFLDTLSARRRLYSLHHIYFGVYSLSRKPYPIPKDVDYVVMNVVDRLTFTSGDFYSPVGYVRLQSLLGGSPWEVVENSGSLVALKRRPQGAPTTPALLSTVRRIPLSASRRIHQDANAEIALLAFEVGDADDDTASLILYWRRTRHCGDFVVCVSLEGDDLIFEENVAPGSRIWPPQSWPAQVIVADRHRVRLRTASPRDGAAGLHVRLVPLGRPIPRSLISSGGESAGY